MNYLFMLLISCLAILCNGQTNLTLGPVPRNQNPDIPKKEVLDALDLVRFDDLKEMQLLIGEGRAKRVYALKEEAFTGWVIKIFTNTNHKFRYTKFEKGEAVWQIGYFDNGDIGHDFHMKNGLNYGSQRMWRIGGDKYIDTYFLEGGVQHGQQFRWHADNILAREALFDQGKLVYEKLFDKKGKLVEEKDEVLFNFLAPKNN